MNFAYTIEFWTVDGQYVRRHGVGQFHPSDNSFKIEHMLWLMAEEFGRPKNIEVIWNFECAKALIAK
jgi:hypothetical protein